MKTCQNCGLTMPSSLDFCNRCGNALTTVTTTYTDTYDIFLSYRRDGGETMAILLRDRLTAKGYNVFLDIENLNSGTFNNKLFDVIDNCKDFVLICSKDSLNRCMNDGDWVRMEIVRALQKNKNIIPIMLRGFVFPDVLPNDMEAVRMHNGVNANSHEYFDASIDRMAEKFLVSKPKVSAPVTSAVVTSTPQLAVAPITAKKGKKVIISTVAGVLSLALIIGAVVVIKAIDDDYSASNSRYEETRRTTANDDKQQTTADTVSTTQTPSSYSINGTKIAGGFWYWTAVIQGDEVYTNNSGRIYFDIYGGFTEDGFFFDDSEFSGTYYIEEDKRISFTIDGVGIIVGDALVSDGDLCIRFIGQDYWRILQK